MVKKKRAGRKKIFGPDWMVAGLYRMTVTLLVSTPPSHPILTQ
jgi:hypothetical protein